MLKKIKILLLLMPLFIACQDHDTIGKIVIEYDKNWSIIITQNNSQTNINGSGRQEFVYKNPDKLSASVTKQDTSLNKLTVYIYEDERIVAAGSTREPEGTVSIEYEFPY
jgi:hypothetical protein